MKSEDVTLKDIAKILNISPSTVSRALNDHPDISAETKKEVQALAAKLHYEPNVIAQQLKSHKTNTIGVIVPEIVHFFFSTVISGIEEVAYEAGYSVMFCQTGESYQREVKDVKALLNHRIDGLLVSFSKETTNFDHFHEALTKIPIVLFDRETDELNVSKVIVDDFEGAVLVTEHLIHQNCKKIAHLAGPQNLKISAERKRGYESALINHGLPIISDYILPCFSGTLEEGQLCTQRLLQLTERPDAIFAHNDMVALGVMQAVKDAGLQIPMDIAIVGFSNWRFTSQIQPQLTTVSQPGYEMGRSAAKRLLAELKDDTLQDHPLREILKTELLIRTSSKKV